MGHPLNYLWPKAAFPRAKGPKIFVFEITTRVLDGLHLWAPDDNEFVSLMWGVIGRALAKHPTVELYGVHILSNHYGILAGFEDQATLEQFKRHLNSCLARETNHCRDRSGPNRSLCPVVVSDSYPSVVVSDSYQTQCNIPASSLAS